MSNTRMNTNISEVDGHLEIDPEDVIEFLLDGPSDTAGTGSTNTTASTTNNLSTLKVTLKLTNPDMKGLPIVFKVRHD
jgi:hypothetical protein